MADKLARLEKERDVAILKASEASDNAILLRAKVEEGRQASIELSHYDTVLHDELDAKIHRLDVEIKKQKASLRKAPRSRQSPFTIGNYELVAHAKEADKLAKSAKDIARRSASAPRVRF